MTLENEFPAKGLTEALHKLSGIPKLSDVVNFLRSHTAEINAQLSDVVIAEIPAFSESRNPDVLADMSLHGPDHTEEILRLLTQRTLDDFKFVRDHARRRAEHRFPLEATLHAYRCGHKVFLRWLREAVLGSDSPGKNSQELVADFAIEYTDTISTIAAQEYVAQTRHLADVAGDQRSQLLSILLEGYDESDGRVAKILHNAGYLDRRQSFCVAVARTVEPGEMLNPTRARRVAESIDETLRLPTTRRLIDLRDNHVVMVFSDARRISGWTAPNKKLASRVVGELSRIGNAILIGVSDDVPSTSQIPAAHRQAVMALDFADVTSRVVQCSDISARRLMLHFAGQELTKMLPSWSEEFQQINEKQNGALLATIRAYANANMNVLKAADTLGVHPNTIYARFQRIVELTGLDPRSYHPLTELLIIAECRSN
jgi:hypothetical protein